MRRLLSVFLCVVMLMSTCVAILPASAADGLQLSVSGAECKAGESATLNVVVKSNPGFAYLCVTPVITDPNGTVIKDVEITVENGSLFSDMTAENNIIFLSETNVTELGTLCTINAAIPEGKPEGIYSLTLKVRECLDENENDVTAYGDSGNITVKSNKPVVTAAQFEIGYATYTKGNEAVDVAVNITENPGISFLSATPYVQNEKGEIISGITIDAENGDLFSDFTFGKNLVFVSESDVTKTGLLATLKVSAADTVPAGTYFIVFVRNECYDENENDVPSKLSLGTFTVADAPVAKYQVTFVDWDGAIISKETYNEGEIIKIPEAPARADDEHYTYTFAGWSPEVAQVAAGNAVYTATYTAKATNNELYISLSNGIAIKKGETTSIQVNVTYNPGIVSGIFTPVIKDPLGNNVTSSFTIEAVNGSVMSDLTADKNLVFLNDNNTTATGLLATLNITAGDAVGAGEHTVSLIPREIYNKNEERISEIVIEPSSFLVEETVSTVRVVKFVDFDGTVLSEKEYNIGDKVAQPKTPTRAADAEYTYTFAGWSPAFAPICTDNVTYTAKYNKTPIKIDEDALRIEVASKTVSKGREVTVPVYITHNPGFMSATLSVKITDAAGNAVTGITLSDYTAGDIFKASEIEFLKNVVILANNNNTKTGTLMNLVLNVADSVELGTYFVNVISRGATNYDEDDVPVDIIAGSLTVADRFTVSFKNYDGTVISEKEYAYGDKIAIPADPAKAPDKTYTYTFAGWSPEVVSECEGDATYTATYDKTYIDYTVKFVDDNGALISTNTYHYGDTVVVPANPAKAADKTYTYSFKSWTPTVASECAGNATYTATYDKTYIDYTVKFVDDNGTEISTKTYHYGDTVVVPANPAKAADKTYTYSFAGWSPAVASTCAGNATYTATYSKTYINYTVKFVNDNGTAISTKTYHYGDKIAVPANPAKAPDKTYTYSFKSWTPAVASECAGDATYTATYDKTYIDYTVEFYDESGALIESKTCHYGDAVTAPEAPEKKSDADYFYTFKEWSGFSGTCTGNAKYYATFNNHSKASTPYILVESKTCMEGKTAEIKVFIKNNPGFMSATVTPYFDSALTLKEVKGGELIKSSEIESGKNIVILCSKDVTADGHLFTLVFDIPEGTEPGDYTIELKVQGCTNKNEDTVDLRFVENGTLTVIDFLWGDANGDGIIDNKDLVRVKKYIAGYDYDTETSDTEVEGGADANGDGIIDNKDLVRLKKYIAGYDYDTGTSDVVLGPTA